MAAPAVNRTYSVQAPLSRFVEFLWYYRSDAPPDPKELVLPAGRADIIIGLRSDVMSIPVGAGGGGGAALNGSRPLLLYSVLRTRSIFHD